MKTSYGFRRSRCGQYLVVIGLWIAATITPLVPPVAAASITVTTTNDGGIGSLRQAIIDANNSAGADTITFDIPGAGVHTIAPTSQLPSLNGDVTIDGYTQPGATPNTLATGDNAVLRIELSGANLGVDVNTPGSKAAIIFAGSNNHVRGLVINRFIDAGVRFSSGSGNVVEGSIIGLDASGTNSFPMDRCLMQVFPFANGLCSSVLVDAASGDATIGGATPAARTIIAGTGTSTGDNIRVNGGTNRVVRIQGSYIGTNRHGTSAIEVQFEGNGFFYKTSNGINLIGSSGVIIGGGAPGAGNVISGSVSELSLDSGATATTIQGNRIGLTADGTRSIGTAISGISLSGGSNNNLIGTDSDGLYDEAEGNQMVGASAWGLVISGSSGNMVRGNIIGDAEGRADIAPNQHGLGLYGGATNNTIGTDGDGVRDAIEGNLIAHNGAAGIWVQDATTTSNRIRGNRIYDNPSGNIQLDNFGRAANDAGDADTGPNDLQNYPRILRTANIGNRIFIAGNLTSAPSSSYTLDFYSAATCGSSDDELPGSDLYLGTATRTSDSAGNLRFVVELQGTVGLNDFITATATGPNGSTSPYSDCGSGGPGNDSWPDAYELPTLGGPAAPGVTVQQSDTEIVTTIKQRIDLEGRSRWYRFGVLPGETLRIEAKDLPVNYDLVVYNDVKRAYDEVLNPAIGAPSYLMARQEAESSPNGVYTGPNGVYTGPNGVYTGPNGVYTGPNGVYTGAGSVDTYPDQYVNTLVTDKHLSPGVSIADGLSQEVFDPLTFKADELAVDAPAAESVAFARAQRRSIIAGSGNGGRLPELTFVGTWLNDRDYYVRVRGHAGAFDRIGTFTLQVTRLIDPACAGVYPNLAAALQQPLLASTMPAQGTYTSILLYDGARMSMTPELLGKLQMLAAHTTVNGVVIDVGSSPRVQALNALVDAPDNFGCVYAKQLVAQAIREIMQSYRTSSTRYGVLTGGDDVIPFFRYPDLTEQDPESSYVPPVKDQTPIQAALQRRYILSQDAYGAVDEVTLGEGRLPVATLAIGRLTETPQDIIGQIDAFLLVNGTVPTPTRAFVTGYDFLADGVAAVADEFDRGLVGASGENTRLNNATGETTRLISPRTCAPTESCAWTADEAKAYVLNKRYDLMYLAGHFDAYAALAADFKTTIGANDLLAASADFRNMIVLSPGCHSGYNVPASAVPPWFEPKPDLPQVFARRGATLIANTGYQYGSAYTIDYGERLYLELSRALRTGSGPISIGDALMSAKRSYAAQLGTSLKGVYQKAYLVSTLYGLPMLRVNMTGERISTTPASNGLVPQTVADGPGATLGLASTDTTVTLGTTVTAQSVALTDQDGVGPNRTATLFSGPNGLSTGWPGEPMLPIAQQDVTVAGRNVQGALFLGGTYTDSAGTPLVAMPATEMHRPAPLFNSIAYFPAQFWLLNSYDQLLSAGSGRTRLTTLPVQFRSTSPSSSDGTFRRYNSLSFRMFYSDPASSFYANGRLLAGPPSIARANTSVGTNSVVFDFQVVGDPAAGVQGVYITWTDGRGSWQTFPLTQDNLDTVRWRGELSLTNINRPGFAYIVQAVSGIGLVAVDDNGGKYFGLTSTSPTQGGSPTPTTLTLDTPIATATVGDAVTFRATLVTNQPLAGQVVTFQFGELTRTAVTGSDGRAQVTVRLDLLPSTYTLGASFNGAEGLATSSARSAVTTTVMRLATTLTASTTTANMSGGGDSNVAVTLRDGLGRALLGAPVFFIITGAGVPNGAISVVEKTNWAGVARLGTLSLPIGSYTVRAYFGGAVPAPVAQTFAEPFYTPAAPVSIALNVSTWPFTGFFSPVDNQPVLNSVKAGSAIPVKFALGGDRGLNILAQNSPTSRQIACSTGVPISPVEELATSQSSGLEYDAASGRYIYSWKSNKAWANTCRQFVLTFTDGTSQRADFWFK